MAIVNIAAYQFVPMEDLPRRREELRELTRRFDLKGTILLTPEGINLFIAGERTGIDALLAKLREYPGLESLAVKESFSDEQPFERMLVKIKREIITFGIEGIEPRAYTSRKLPPRELRQWLAEGRDVTLYDVRNDYEVEVGTFQGALPAGIDHFRRFPEAVAQLPDELKERPIVMFCTGGIRCEKAGPFMERAGFREIYQLDGGILKYFEECGGDYYDGDCFVFDKRTALSPTLEETATTQCFACLAPVPPRDQLSPQYNPPLSCPRCFESVAEKQRKLCVQREAAIAEVCTPLPGSTPYDNVRPISIPLRLDHVPLIDALCDLYPHVTRETWNEQFATNRIVHHEDVVPADRIVRAGERYGRRFPAVIEPDVSVNIKVLFEDQWLIVLNKPAPLPMHPCGRFNRNSLEWILHQVYSPQKPRPGHRLDANTTGIVVFTKSRHVAGKLQPQFERGEVTKTYLARVQGHVTVDGLGLVPGVEFRCDAPISRESQLHGGRNVEDEGLTAATEFRVLEVNPDGTSVLEVHPLTGRTNQIRVHLWHLGIPICGDPLYLKDGQMGEQQTNSIVSPALQLHAWKLKFTHPGTGQPVEFTAPPVPHAVVN